MINTICNAYAFIEFNKSYAAYVLADDESRTASQLMNDWIIIEEDYKKVTNYMTDDALKQTHDLVMNEF